MEEVEEVAVVVGEMEEVAVVAEAAVEEVSLQFVLFPI